APRLQVRGGWAVGECLESRGNPCTNGRIAECPLRSACSADAQGGGRMSRGQRSFSVSRRTIESKTTIRAGVSVPAASTKHRSDANHRLGLIRGMRACPLVEDV